MSKISTDNLIFIFMAGLLVGFILLTGLRFGVGDPLNTTPEQNLGLPVNIHHDFLGLLLIIGGIILFKVFKLPKSSIFIIGLGLGVFIEHLMFEGLVLISPMV